MYWQYPPYMWMSLITGMVAVGLAIYSWHRRKIPGGFPFVFLLLSVAVWSFAYTLQLNAFDLSYKRFWNRFVYIGVQAIPVAWLALSLQYTGRSRLLTRRNLLLLSIFPLLTLVLVFTNDAHHLMFESYLTEIKGGYLFMDTTPGPWFWVQSMYAYGLSAAALVLLIFRAKTIPARFRGQIIVLLVGFSIGLFWAFIYSLGVSPTGLVDPSPAVILVGLGIIAWGLFRYQLFDVTPLAREIILERMQEGVIMLDMRGRVLFINPAASRVFGLNESAVLAHPVAEVFSKWPQIVSLLTKSVEGKREICLEVEGEATTYDLLISRFTETNTQNDAVIITLRDISERKWAEEELLKHRDRLDDLVKKQTANLLEANQQLQIEVLERQKSQGREERRNKKLDILSQAAIQFVEMAASKDIYYDIGRYLFALMDVDASVIINAYDQETEILRVHNVFGIGNLGESLVSLLGRHPAGMTFDFIPHYAKQSLLKGKLIKVEGGLYELSFNKIPQPICKGIESLYKIHHIYIMGLSQKGRLYGNIVIILREDEEIRDSDIIETYLYLAAVALQRAQAEESLRRERDLISNIMNVSPVGVVRVDADGQITFANDRALFVLGLAYDEINNRMFNSPDWKITDLNGDPLPEEDLPFQQIKRKKEVIYDIRHAIQKPEGEQVLLSINAVPVLDENNQLEGMVSTVEDITQRVYNEARLTHLATHDTLTHLPNRMLFNDRLNHAIAKAYRNNKLTAVLFMDLDGFKAFNDAFSHERGDRLLQIVADRISSCVRASDTVARMGGDEFVVLLEDVNSTADAASIAAKILKAVSQPFVIETVETFITLSIGISIYPNNGDNAESLLQCADSAMYRAKSQGKNNYEFYSPEMAHRALERLEIINDLRYALERNQLSLCYQPQVHIGIGKIVGVEALLRWNHPEKGAISPNVFIPLAEETGLIHKMGEWVMHQACEDNRAWAAAGYGPVRVAVNLSEYQLKQPDLIDILEYTLKQNCLNPNLLELEMTENIIFSNIDEAGDLFQEFKKMGLQLAIDDFGSGYSTLQQLSRFPFDTLKIDQSLVRNISTNPRDGVVIAGIISIARELGMNVIAEGVETQDQLAFYELHGCALIQGWYFSRAIPATNFAQLLDKGYESLFHQHSR